MAELFTALARCPELKQAAMLSQSGRNGGLELRVPEHATVWVRFFFTHPVVNMTTTVALRYVP